MIVQSYDTAAKKKNRNAWTVCMTWFMFSKKLYIVDVFRKRMEYPELKRVAINLADHWHPDLIIIEAASSGVALCQDLKAETTYSVLECKPTKDKIARASACSPTIESGRVYVPNKADWLLEFEKEVSLFPMSTFKDQVDTLSEFLAWERQQNIKRDVFLP